MLSISNYHYIREDFTAKYPSIFGVTPANFRKQLEALAKQAEFISLEELHTFRDKPFEKNYILISFDDGLREQFELAKPILDDMGIPAAFFINTVNYSESKVSLVHKIHLLRSQLAPEEILKALDLETKSPLSETEKKQAVFHYNYDDSQTAFLKYQLNFKMTPKEQEGVITPLFHEFFEEQIVASELYFSHEMLQKLHSEDALGSHSHHHLPLGQLSKEELESELHKTQGFFQETFGELSRAISYPYGSFDACKGISKEVAKAGFKIGFTMERATNKSLIQDSLLLSRYDCNDLPRGKNDLFKGTPIFTNPPLRKWHTHEDSLTHKR